MANGREEVSWLDWPDPISYEKGEILFEDWEIEQELGQGASGSVYLLTKELMGLKQEAAMKVVHLTPDKAMDQMLRSMGQSQQMIATRRREALAAVVREIAVMMSLKDHPNVVRCEDYKVYRIGDEDNWDIQIKMERLKSLNAKMEEGLMTDAEAAKLGVDVCAALTACEQYSLIHRDIKPANIFVDRWGHYKLGDFGTARAQGSGSTMTQKAGTELYMAPEVMRGGHYDKRVDIYSLGLVLYQLTNGNRLPFYPAPEQITQRAMEDAWERRMRGEALPAPERASPAFARVILKACAYKPEDRYGSARAFSDALEQAVQSDLGQREKVNRETAARQSVPAPAPVQRDSYDASPLLTRARLSLEDEEWEEADRFAEQILNSDPQSADAYMVKLCAEKHVSTEGKLTNCAEDFGNNVNYKRALRFADAEHKAIYEGYHQAVLARIEAARKAAEESARQKAIRKAKERETYAQAKVKVGDIVTFGRYPQNVDGTDKTPIEWQVLATDGKTATLISRYALDCKPYNTKSKDVTWETCSLRRWLNGTFLQAAFSAEEQKRLQTVQTDKNPSYSTNPGKAIQDRVYLLSIREAGKYFSTKSARVCKPTAYAKAQGEFMNITNSSDARRWWLRSPSSFTEFAADVDHDGSVNRVGKLVIESSDAVRPVVVIRLSN